MCGFTGIYGFNMIGQLSMINLAASTKALASRGPDFQNTYNDQKVGLGHRRLSVIDTSQAGHQPMSDPTGRYQLVYNGEIYNYRALRENLKTKGFHFRSESDTEVLLYHLIEKGTSGISDLNGFFSFCFYDRERDYLLLSIDRSGIKPLYYLKDENRVIFASEIKSLNHYGLDREIDATALMVYFQLNYIPAPLTIFKDVKKMMPGEYLEIYNNKVNQGNWHESHSHSNTQTGLSFEESTKKFRELMELSVQRRMVSDVPLGTFLSGGIDSSIISLLAKKFNPDLNTFSIGFEEKYFDESEYSTEVAQHIGSNHHHFTMGFSQFEENLESILDYIDEPFADSSAIAYYLLSKETRKVATVALSGDGSDELFGGYRKHFALNQSLLNTGTNALLKVSSPFLKILPSSRSNKLFDKFRQAQRYSGGLWKSPAERYWSWAVFQDENRVKNFLSAKFLSSYNPSEFNDLKDYYLESLKNTKDLNSFLWVDQSLVLPWDMLTKVDRMSMANSLEVRVPFLDPEIIQFAQSLPSEYKISGKQTKRMVYEAFKNDLPEKLFHRPKQGFEVPLLKWLRVAIKDKAFRFVFDREFVEDQGIFNYKKVRRLKNSLYSISPGDAHAHTWAYLVFQWWYKKYLG